MNRSEYASGPVHYQRPWARRVTACSLFLVGEAVYARRTREANDVTCRLCLRALGGLP